MSATYRVHAIGVIRKSESQVRIEVDPSYHEGLMGLEGFSHVNVFFWFHENDSDDKRHTLQVHPCRDSRNPLTGVFATHSPLRPNLIGMTLCRILDIRDTTIVIEDIDALDSTPVLDLKCYIPPSVLDSEVWLPQWVLHRDSAERPEKHASD